MDSGFISFCPILFAFLAISNQCMAVYKDFGGIFCPLTFIQGDCGSMLWFCSFSPLVFYFYHDLFEILRNFLKKIIEMFIKKTPGKVEGEGKNKVQGVMEEIRFKVIENPYLRLIINRWTPKQFAMNPKCSLVDSSHISVSVYTFVPFFFFL